MTVTEIMARALHEIKIDERASGMRLSEASTARKLVKALKAAGHAIVPIEPTEAMIEAITDTGPVGCCNISKEDAECIYDAIIQAAGEQT